MQKLRILVENNSKWAVLLEYIDRIEASKELDFSLALENAKCVLETIGKEICSKKGVELESKSTMAGVLKNAFNVLGLGANDSARQISTALGTIGQNFGTIRNQIGATAHGKTVEQLEQRNEHLSPMTRTLLIDTVVTVGCFMINLYESEEIGLTRQDKTIHYEDMDKFNSYLDDTFGSFDMGVYSFPASEVLFYTDPNAYSTELDIFETMDTNMDDDE